MFEKITFKSGLRVIVVPQKQNTQAVTVLALVKTGSKHEKKEEKGISHFLEHMLFKGTKKRPSPIKVVETLDRIGGAYDAFTSQDYTGYWAKVSAEKFDLALDWIADIFFNSLFEPKEIKKEKGVVIEEINMIFDNPANYIGFLWRKLLYGDQPAGWHIVGTKETVAGMGRENLLDYIKNQYVAKNTVLCLAGKLDRKKALAKAEKYFSKIKRKKPLEKPLVREKQRKPSLVLQTRKTQQTHLRLGFRGYSLFDQGKWAEELLAVILGGMMSSRLFGKIREEMGAAYYINTIASFDPDTGFLLTGAGVDNGRVEEVIEVILKEHQQISQKGVPEKELKKAKDYLKGRLALSLESSDNQASFYGMQEVLQNKILSLRQIFNRIDQVSGQDILKTGREIFVPERLNLALIGPFKDKNKFQKLLKV